MKEERQKKEYEAAEKKKKDAEYQKLLEYNKSDASNLILGNEDIYQDDSSEDEMKVTICLSFVYHPLLDY